MQSIGGRMSIGRRTIKQKAWGLLAQMVVVCAEVCMDAVGFIYLEAEDELFEPLVPASGAYRVISGHFRYTQTPGVSKVVDIDVTEVPRHAQSHPPNGQGSARHY
eukprot:5060249-Amphidinium_carterae.1